MSLTYCTDHSNVAKPLTQEMIDAAWKEIQAQPTASPMTRGDSIDYIFPPDMQRDTIEKLFKAAGLTLKKIKEKSR